MKNFIGNVKNLDNLVKVFSTSPMPHSVIINCSNFTDVLELSKFLAKCILCENKNSLGACLGCNVCRKIDSGLHPDVIFPERSGTMSTYSVATVRKIRLDSQILPNESPFKLYIFFDAQNILVAAQNALLKNLEDAPKHAVFLFFCNNLEKILPTVKSRSLIYELEFLENQAELKVEEFSKELLIATQEKNELELLKIVSKVSKDKTFLKKVLLYMASKIQVGIALKLENAIEDDLLFKNFTFERLKTIGDVLNETNFMLEKNVNSELLLAYFSSSLC